MSYLDDKIHGLSGNVGRLTAMMKENAKRSTLEQTINIQAQTIAKLLEENGELRARIATYELGKTNDVQSNQQGIVLGKRKGTIPTTPATVFTIRQRENLLGQ